MSAERIAAGYNYIRPQDDTEDKLGHGTAVAAIIAGSEKARITGICPTAALVPLVYCSADGDGNEVSGGAAMTAQAVYDAVDVYGCRIINISSGTATDSKALCDAVDYAASRGALVVSRAGNAGRIAPETMYYPGGYESVLCVGACNADGTAAGFSQKNETVDLLARGADLRLASIRGTRIRGEGTSFAAAVVSGTAAQLWTLHPAWTANEVRAALFNTAQVIDGLRVLDPQRTLAVCAAAFSDVPEGAWYSGAAAWAAAHGVVQSGTGRFAPDAPCHPRGDGDLPLPRGGQSQGGADGERLCRHSGGRRARARRVLGGRKRRDQRHGRGALLARRNLHESAGDDLSAPRARPARGAGGRGVFRYSGGRVVRRRRLLDGRRGRDQRRGGGALCA